MKYGSLAVIVCGLVIGGILYISADSNVVQPAKTLSIHEIKAQKPASGIFETEGFIVKIYTAPPCPPDAVCKPSMKDNVVISEDNKTLLTYDLTDKELILFTEETAFFELGKKYHFKIKITDQKTTGEEINDVEMLSYKAVN